MVNFAVALLIKQQKITMTEKDKYYKDIARASLHLGSLTMYK